MRGPCRRGRSIMATYVDILKSEFPEIDTEVFDYITGVLDSGGADFEDGEEVFDAIGGVLQEVSADCKNEDDIRDICLQMFNTLKLNNCHTAQKQVLLDAPVQLSQISTEHVSASSDVQGIWMTKRGQNTTVDAKKLEKAEAKLKAKHEKRNEKDSQKPPSTVVLEEASASQASSKKDSRVDVTGKNRSYDIRIENFDVSFGERSLLQGAELALAAGRRYGLVGRNGLGKTTLLKMLASRSLRVPPHISILHVEQEVAGDDTGALQSVLESDTVREGLLHEERTLNARIANGTVNQGPESTQRGRLYWRRSVCVVVVGGNDTRAGLYLRSCAKGTFPNPGAPGAFDLQRDRRAPSTLSTAGIASAPLGEYPIPSASQNSQIICTLEQFSRQPFQERLVLRRVWESDTG
ncbi:hypothetical protein ACEWY4_008370 [Coilia grayii]|uniref:Uncharacterized protein n=1 Tax=Coilia grayii TaxID=363190 RepID=A0ABD1KAP8_9TELE